jgi:hypothetical protein
LCVFLLLSRQGEERVFMFPGTSCLVPIYVQNRELVKSPMTTIDNDDIALIGLSVEYICRHVALIG